MSRNNSRDQILEAALALITRRGEANVTMAEIGKAAGVSRQAVYLNFADRADLMLALVRYVDERRGLEQELEEIRNAPTGLEAVRALVALQARSNPQIWSVARAFDAVRRTDAEVEKSWQDRLNDRLQGCRRIIARLAEEGVLRKGIKPAAAADILWSVTSLRGWEDLVVQRGWSPAQYEKHVYEMLKVMLTTAESS
jgi:AcrR family transcriptional regulator